jgi:hypothetical protein
VFAFVVLRGDRPTGARREAFTKELRAHVTEQLGALARPDDIRFSDNLPKTRSGKIMRRLLRAIARNEDITQDLSTLENPAIIDQLRGDETAPAAAPVKRAPKAKRKPASKRKARLKKALPKKKPAKKAASKTAAKRSKAVNSAKAKKPARKKAPARKK